MQRMAQKGGAARFLGFLREIGKGRRHESLAVGADFGWRLHGKIVRSLSDSSLQLLPSRQLAHVARLTEYCTSGTPLQSCLQCGACTVTCRLAEAHSQFPRRQMTLLQIGDTDRLLADPKVWMCFNCEDCTSACPAKAGPGRVMAAVRRLAVEHYSVPYFWGRIANRRSSIVGLMTTAVVLLFVAIAVGGSFSPQASPVRFSSMVPHGTVNVFFGVVLAAALMTAAVSASRAWRAFTSETLRTTSFRRVSRAFVFVLREIATHRHFSECQQFPGSRWAHGLVLYGFLTLFVLAALAAVLIATGNRYPFPVLHPLKVVGNVAAVLIIAGSWYFLAQRVRASRSGQASSWFDWALPVQLLLISVTGVLAEIFRYTNVAEAAYPTYLLHLVLVFILFASAPTSKLAHVFYRTVALTAEHYNATSRMKVAGLYARKLAA